ncbi:hypothetical protein AJ80_08746 [Polytolypa hystricis UAMH7299]|uniref:Hsp70 nucleotide exchange factor FES1 n=1 Tax=Polytolypa hystricis (strain UAMH7299) TaxID=1447883 RepID=A0A2B7X2P4_POLH7|nr:hypothetical protein AJ80_08746 [Polytolypa hystricis UAMH7299]
MDPSMQSLLKWGIENSQPSTTNPSTDNDSSAAATTTTTTTTGATGAPRSLSPSALQRLFFNTPSDAELMKAAMHVIRSTDATLENKLVAFDNFEQLVENLDNANNMDVLGLWAPLVQELEAEEAERRMMAAWCIGTAVQNNERAQEKLIEQPTSLPTLLRISQTDPDKSVRRKAIYALSSAVRNHQAALDEFVKHLPAHLPDDGDDAGRDELIGGDGVEAGDMERIDEIISRLKKAVV